MSTNASTWFYNEPEHDAYLIEERVNHTLWAARMGFLYLDCRRAEPPFQMMGQWDGASIEIEWEVKHYFILRTSKDMPKLRRGFSQILGIRPPSLAYQDGGDFVTEWRLEDDDARWSEIEKQYSGAVRHPK